MATRYSGANLGTAPNTMGFVAMSTLDGDRSSTFRELLTANPNPVPKTKPDPAPPVQADNGPKEVPIVKNPQDESGYENELIELNLVYRQGLECYQDSSAMNRH